MSRGGSAALARALEAAARESGGEIRLMTEPRRISLKAAAPSAIETAEGEVIRARHFVASSLNPQQTFLDLLDRRIVPRDIRDRAQRFQYNLLAPLFALNLNLREPPRYRAQRQSSRAGAGVHGDHGARSCATSSRHRPPS